MENEVSVAEPTVAEIATAPVANEPIQSPSVAEVASSVPEVVATPETVVAPVESVEKAEAPTHPPSLLSEAKSDEVVKPDDLVSEENKSEEPTPEQPKAPEPIIYEEFKFPEDVKVNQDEIEEFTKTVGEFGVPQEAAQKLMDMHTKAVESITKQVAANQWEVFNNTQRDWVTQVMADPILGGSGHQTAMNMAAQARDVVFDHNAEKIQQFNEIMSLTGAGNHPIVIEYMYNVNKYIRPGEPLDTQIKPPSDIGSKTLTRAERMYGSSK